MTGRARRQQRKRARTRWYIRRECIDRTGRMGYRWERTESRGGCLGFVGHPVPERAMMRTRP